MAVASSSGIVGRAVELAKLLAALERAEQGRPALVLVGGCLEVGDVGLPYVPLIAALRGFAAEADNDELLAAAAKGLPGLGRLLPELVDQPAADTVPFNHSLEQLQLFDGVR